MTNEEIEQISKDAVTNEASMYVPDQVIKVKSAIKLCMAQAYEEAAKLADSEATAWGDESDSAKAGAHAAATTAKRIRALKDSLSV